MICGLMIILFGDFTSGRPTSHSCTHSFVMFDNHLPQKYTIPQPHSKYTYHSSNYIFLGALLRPFSIFQLSSTAGHTNQRPPTERGTVHPIRRGIIFDLAHRNIDAVPTEPKRGRGRGCMARVRACSILN